MVSFQKIDHIFGVIIIGAEVTHICADITGANFSYVADDVVSPRGRRHKGLFDRALLQKLQLWFFSFTIKQF
jgi:hypothetical protein